MFLKNLIFLTNFVSESVSQIVFDSESFRSLKTILIYKEYFLKVLFFVNNKTFVADYIRPYMAVNLNDLLYSKSLYYQNVKETLWLSIIYFDEKGIDRPYSPTLFKPPFNLLNEYCIQMSNGQLLSSLKSNDRYHRFPSH